MRQKLTDAQIAATVQALRGRVEHVTWRLLQTQLRLEFGAAGRTDRLRAACRTDQPAIRPAGGQDASLDNRLREAQQQLALLQQERDLALERALRAEEREVRHQDRWAGEIHALRQAVNSLREERAQRQLLERQVLRLQQELHGLHVRLAREGPDAGPAAQG